MPANRIRDPRGQGRECWRWGSSGTIYCGRGAKGKAVQQGTAILISEGKVPGKD